VTAPSLATGPAQPRAGRRILIVAPEAPSPPMGGFSLRVHHLAGELARRHQVTLLTYGTPDDGHDWSGLGRTLAAVHSVPPPPTLRLGPSGTRSTAARRAHQLASVCSRGSFHLGSLRSRAMQQTLDRLVDDPGFDLIQVESSQMMWVDLPGPTPVVLDEHNVEFALLERVAGVERSPLRRWYGRLEAGKARGEERRCWERVDGCVVTSAADEAIIQRERPGSVTGVVPNGVDTEHFRPAAGETPEGSGMVFVGRMDYRPNVDAVEWFVRTVLPLVRAAEPTAVLTVVGGGGVPPALRRLSGPGLVMTGLVDDVRPFVHRAAMVVVPLRAGGGTRLKLLEALAMAKPVVSTSVGAEGVDVIAGEHLLTADSPEPMADQILRVMAERGLGPRLGLAGRSLVLDRYSWSASARRLEEFHDRIAASAERGWSPGRRMRASPPARPVHSAGAS
jgi:glycosyltransferase involved in cell wall biosynthesis